MGDKYSKKLHHGGTLEVDKKEWGISYYFPGPDLRYNGTSIWIPGREVKEYIEAFKQNWEAYQKLLSVIPPGDEYETSGKKGMTIRVNSSFSLVVLITRLLIRFIFIFLFILLCLLRLRRARRDSNTTSRTVLLHPGSNNRCYFCDK